MMNWKLFSTVGLGAILLLAAAAIVLVVPPVMGRGILAQISHATGWQMTGAKNARLIFTPQLAIVISDAQVAGDKVTATVPELLVPIDWVDLITLFPKPSSFVLKDSSWVLHSSSVGPANAGKSDQDRAASRLPAITITFDGGDISRQDNDGTSTTLAQKLLASVVVRDDESADVEGSAEITGARTHFETTVTSVSRLFAEGSPVEASLDAAGASLAFSGRARIDRSVDLAGTIAFHGPDIKKLFRITGQPQDWLRDGISYAADGSLDHGTGKTKLVFSTLAIGAMKGKGSFTREAEGPPHLAVIMDTVNLDQLLTISPPVPSATTASWSATPVFSNGSNPTDFMVDVAATAFQYRSLKLESAALKINRSGAVTTGTLADQKNSMLDFTLDQTKPVAKLALTIAVEAMEGAEVLPALTGVDVADGPITLHASLQSQGNSQSDIIGNLAGSGDVLLKGGKLKGVNIGSTLQDVASGIVEGWNGDVTAPVDATAKFTVADGIASLTAASIQTVGASLSGDGDIDILRKALDLKVDTVALGDADSAYRLPVKIRVEGPGQSRRSILT